MKANALLALIKEKGISVSDFCEKTGIPRSTFYRKLAGETCFDTQDIKSICKAIGIKDGSKIKDIFLT